MAVAFRSISNTTYGAAAASVTCTPPTGLANGDVMLAMVFQLAGNATAPGTPTAPAGWTQVGADQTQAFSTGSRVSAWKKVAASESGSYTWSWTFNTVSAQAVIACYSGSNGTVNVSSSNTGVPANTTRTFSTVTTTAANCMLVGLGWDFADNTTDETPPTGMTERLDNVVSYCCDVIQASAAASGDKTNTCNSNANSPRGGFLIALEEGTAPASAPAFRAVASIAYAGRTNTTVSKPTGTVDGDIMVAVMFAGASASQAAALAVTPPAGWTLIGTTTAQTQTGGGFHGAFFVYWKRASSEGASYQFLHSTLSTNAAIASYSGCIASGSPVDVFSQNGGTTGTSTSTGTAVTTTVTDTKLVYCQHNWDGTGQTPPTGMTERYDSLAYLADQDIASTGSTGTRTQTMPSSNVWQVYMVALKPVAGAAAGKPVKVWSGSAWVTKTLKVWSGSAWVTKPAKVWNGSGWV